MDTNVWLWSLSEPNLLSRAAYEILADPAQELFLSAASLWEIAIKWSSGKLRLPEPPSTYVPRAMAQQGLRPLAISAQHVLAVSGLPQIHRDPFDRLLAVQSNLEDMTLITADRIFERYPVKLLWAGR